MLLRNFAELSNLGLKLNVQFLRLSIEAIIMMFRLTNGFQFWIIVINVLFLIIYTVSGNLLFSQEQQFRVNKSVIDGQRFDNLKGAISPYNLPLPVSTTLKSTQKFLLKKGRASYCYC